MAERFVKTMKQDYVAFKGKPPTWRGAHASGAASSITISATRTKPCNTARLANLDGLRHHQANGVLKSELQTQLQLLSAQLVHPGELSDCNDARKTRSDSSLSGPKVVLSMSIVAFLLVSCHVPNEKFTRVNS